MSQIRPDVVVFVALLFGQLACSDETKSPCGENGCPGGSLTTGEGVGDEMRITVTVTGPEGDASDSIVVLQQ